MRAPWLEQLNDAQREAVTHGDGPLLVVAGAGTGKTRTLASRVAYLMAQGVEPDRILLLTFTRRAAAEMLSRAARLTDRAGETDPTPSREVAGGKEAETDSGPAVGNRPAVGGPVRSIGKVWGGTFHAVANRLLRIHGRALDLPPDFTVMDADDAAGMMSLIRSELGLAKRDRRFPGKRTLVKVYSHTVNAQEQLRGVVETHFPWCGDDIDAMAEIFEQYTQRKSQQHLLDYDDLLLYWQTLCNVPGAGAKMADRFEHVLVDEYQDTNKVQAQILRGLRKRYDNIMVVGDDAQSIYSFRAATIRNILDFPDDFPGARVVTLERNYRSTQPILAVANAVMEQAKERYTKELWSDRRSSVKPILVHCEDEAQQTAEVCANIIAHLEEGVSLMNQSVLFRAGHHSAELEVELARRNIPFHKFGGLKFIEAAHIKDTLAMLRVLENPHDQISWFRVLQLIDGIGPRTARRILETLESPPESPAPTSGVESEDGEQDGNPAAGGTTSPLVRLINDPPAVPPRAKEQFESLRCAMEDCCARSLGGAGDDAKASEDRKGSTPTISLQIERITKFYKPIFERVYENAAPRLRDIEQLERVAKRYRSRSRFITDLTLDPPTSTSDLAGPPHLDEDWLTLSTIHSAKGCEWKVVNVLHAADGMIPSDMATGNVAGVDEERRLFYVALTRAKDHLYVYFPFRYYHRRYATGDGHSYAQLTRFIPDPVRRMFEERSACDSDSEDAADEDASRPTNVKDMRASLNRLWRED